MADGYHAIRLERSGAVATLTLDRPRRLNAINKQMLLELQHALDTVEGDPELRALVVNGAGANFSSGFDLSEQMEARPTGVEIWREILERDFGTITLASEDAIFGEPELKFGAGIVVMILPWLVGPKHAKEIILRGMDRIPAQEALRIGLINRIVSVGELDSAALALARDIAVIDPHLVQQTKRAINRTFQIMGLVDALEAAL